MKKNYPAKFIYFQNKRRELFQRQLMRCSNNFSRILILFQKISSSLSQNIQYSSSKPQDIFLDWLFSGFFVEVCLAFIGSLFFESDTFLISLETKKKNTEKQQFSRQRKGALLHSFVTRVWLDGLRSQTPQRSCQPPKSDPRGVLHPTTHGKVNPADQKGSRHLSTLPSGGLGPTTPRGKRAFWKLLTVSSSISWRVLSVTSR